MEINRREFITRMAALLTLSTLGVSAVKAASSKHQLASCRTDDNGKHFISLMDVAGNIDTEFELPDRGHGLTLSPDAKQLAVFFRRPGWHLWIIDLNEKHIRHKIAAADQRHFYGHGIFSKDGQLLFCTENNFETGKGCIGIYRVKNNYQRIGEYDSFGIGPHEICLSNDGSTLIVANGGIKTHPDIPRVKSNLNSMKPNLSYISIETGQLLEQVNPPSKWHQLSMRHIDVSKNDTVAIAMQFEGYAGQRPPLIGVHKRGQPLKLLLAPNKVQKQLKNYCGSVTFNTSGDVFAVSSPRGGLVTYWQENGAFLGIHTQLDVCGIASVSNHFITSDGAGGVATIKSGFSIDKKTTFANTHWDNHLINI